ncbi:MAG: hypothetical protein EAX86_13655 [Candidatus Heimdallarchaeota archaeon]|nr:hypothetical protein [Candidatus Heimdallarchaeota archaeon]
MVEMDAKKQKEPSESPKPQRKILLMALSASGRTGIAKKFIDETWPQDDKAYYKPTIDYERHTRVICGTEFVVFDCGGQTAFMDQFTGKLAEFMFSKVASLVFCVNASANGIGQISRAKYYFDLALHRLETYSPSAMVFLILTKMDLVPESLEEEVVEAIITYILHQVPKKVIIFHTSIFDYTATQAVESIIRANLQVFDPVISQLNGKRFKTLEDPFHTQAIQEALRILKSTD